MQVIYKIAEKQRKTRAGFMQLMDYISRDSFKTFGVGTSDNKNIAIKHYLSNKDLHKKNRDGKDRFTYHVMASFGADVPIEKVVEIMEEFCTDNFYDKGFNSFFAVHTDTNNIHCHVIADNVNFNTGNMIHSVTQKQYDSMSQKKKEKAETFVYEKQRELFEDICIKHGLDISMEERYEYMHEQKQKEGRKWLTKEQYRAKKDKDSWTNEIKDKLEQIYKNEDVNEDNIKDIAGKYGLEVTRHNKDKKYITFALLDEQGKRTNQKLKLVQELNKKKKKSQDEVTEDTVKLAVKLDTLEVQEKELKKDSSENVFNYDNFFGGKKKEEIEKREETREEILEFFAKEKEKLRIRLEAEAKAKEVKEDIKPVKEVKEDIKPVEEVKEDIRPVEEVKEDIRPVKEVKEDIKPVEEVKEDIRPVEEVKEDIKTPVNTYIVEDSKPSDFELEKEYKTEKDILDNFYKTQEENKKEQDSKAKALEEEVKNIEKAEIDKITKSDEVLRRLNVEEEERQQEAKAKKEQETDLKTTDEIIKTGEEKEIAVAEVESKQEITNSDFTDIDSKSTITESKQEKQEEEKQDLEPKQESKQVDLDSLIDRIDSYKLVEEYDLFDTLPQFQIFTDELIYDSETGEGEIELAKSLIVDVKGEEYWKNMNLKDITKWEETGVFTIAYAYDSMDNFKEFAGYEDYSKSTIKQFLEINTELAEELAEQYMPRDSKKKEQDSKDIEIKKDKDREIDF
jgi:exonuclease SbcC